MDTADFEKLERYFETAGARKPESIEPIAAGLGTRRFFRVKFSNGEPMSMIARVESQADSVERPRLSAAATWLPEPALEPLRSFLESAGLPVPSCYAHLAEQGIDLLEDVGDRCLKDVEGPRKTALYGQACELVPKLQALDADAREIPAFGRNFDRRLIESKAWKFLNWTIPGLLGRNASAGETESINLLFGEIGELLDAAPRRLAHRDFKAENLHVVSDDHGKNERLVMIDVQGAFMAPPEYDLVCLLYDLQVELHEDFAMQAFRSTCAELPDSPDPSLALLRFDAIATLRLCKDISHLVDAGRSRNDRRRWNEIPRGLSLLDRAVGRLAYTFPQTRVLNSVIQALTVAVGSTDISNDRSTALSATEEREPRERN